MIRNLDTALIRSFVTVAETASMTAAANALHLTQGAISQQIKRLEEAFECALFERDRRGLKLTNAGERLFGKAKRLLGLNDEIWAELTTPAFSGEIKLGLPYDLVTTYLPPILKAYAQAFPQVEISLVCLTSPMLAEAVNAGEIDLAVVEAPVGQTIGECLSIERLVWVGCKGGEAYRKAAGCRSLETRQRQPARSGRWCSTLCVGAAWRGGRFSPTEALRQLRQQY